MTALGSLRMRLRRLKAEDGTATIPFLIFFPTFILMLLVSIEVGLLTVKQVMLERGLDLAVRRLRLGNMGSPTATDVKREICNGTGIIYDCMNNLMVELTTIDRRTWAMPQPSATCTERNKVINPPTFNAGASDEILLIRVCAKVTPIAPGTGFGMLLPKDAQGQYSLVSMSAFVNEPRRE